MCLFFSHDSILKTESVSAEAIRILQLSAVFVKVNVPKDRWNETTE